MKRFFTFLLVVTVLFGCNLAEKAYNKGQYDLAINRAVKKLRKKPNDMEHMQIVEDAFMKAVDNDNRRLNFLKQEGNPNAFDQMYQIYKKLNARQNLVRTLPVMPTNISFVNYDSEMISSKKKAAEFLYANAEKLMAKNDRGAARRAYADLKKVKGYIPNFKDVDAKIAEAQFLGTSNVMFKMTNATGIPLPPQFEKDLKKISIASMNQQWINYFNVPNENLYFDYNIVVNMKVIDVAPEFLKEREFVETKKVADGFEYVLDKQGNVMKDSLGNDIKLPKTKLIQCTVHETIQKKSARIAGTIDYIDNRTNELIKSEPITADSFFEHHSATANGDFKALKPATAKMIGVEKMPYPADFAMLLDCSGTLKNMIKDIIFRNKAVLN